MNKLKSCNFLSKKTSKIRINVRYSETDTMSFVHHSNYLKYYEIGRLAWFKNIGFSYKKLESENIILPVVETKIKFRTMIRVYLISLFIIMPIIFFIWYITK